MDPFWNELPIHVIDFEGGPRCGIVEYGVVSLNGSEIAQTATNVCKPKAPISRKDQATHGIANQDVRAAQPFAQEWDRFALLRETGPLAAHFASAENSMIKSVFPYPRSSKCWIQSVRKTVDWGPWIDTGHLYRNYGDSPGSYRLQDLVAYFELQVELDELAAKFCPNGRRGYHCALYDALASTLLLLLYCTELSDISPTVRSLIVNSQGSGEKKQEIEQENLF